MSDSVEIDQMVAELKAAGWTPKSSVYWRSPTGGLHLGPAGAWRTMKSHPPAVAAEPYDTFNSKAWMKRAQEAEALVKALRVGIESMKRERSWSALTDEELEDAAKACLAEAFDDDPRLIALAAKLRGMKTGIKKSRIMRDEDYSTGHRIGG